MRCCNKCYAIDAVVNGQVVRKMKHRKHLTKVNEIWYDYRNQPVVDAQEIARLNGLASDQSEVDCVWYDDHAQFMDGFVQHEGVQNIPATKHTVICNWSPSSGEESTLSVLNAQAIDGDSLYIIIKNMSGNKGKLTVPSGGQSAHVWGKTVTVNAGENISIKATYAGGIWYFENLHDVPVIPDIPGQGETPDPDAEPIDPGTGTDIQDADIIVLRYYWEESGGIDLDTMTELTNTGIPEVDGRGVGWSGPGNGTSQVTSILHWGGGNTSSGNECVYIDLRDFLANNEVDQEFIDVDVYATWFNTKGDGDFRMYVKAYKGGSMTKDGYNFINSGGQEVFSGYLTTNTSTYKGVEDYHNNYDRIATISFSKDLTNIKIIPRRTEL